MRVFVTGATGFVGSAVIEELIRSGHQVLALARSEESAKIITNAGAEAHPGDLEDFESLRSGAAACDGVIHMGFIHDFSRYNEVCEIDRQVIETLGAALAGSNRPLVITSGVGLLGTPGRLATETDMPSQIATNPRIASEIAADAAAEMGVRVAVVRLPPSVHGEGDHGFVPIVIGIAKEKGISVYNETIKNRWPAVHRLDAAVLFRLALENNAVGPVRYHAVAEEGIVFRDIAEAVGKGLNLPVSGKTAEEAAGHFTWFNYFAEMDCAASSVQTTEMLGWKPVRSGLIADLEESDYFKI